MRAIDDIRRHICSWFPLFWATGAVAVSNEGAGEEVGVGEQERKQEDSQQSIKSIWGGSGSRRVGEVKFLN